jgi:hypothetical protein
MRDSPSDQVLARARDRTDMDCMNVASLSLTLLASGAVATRGLPVGLLRLQWRANVRPRPPGPARSPMVHASRRPGPPGGEGLLGLTRAYYLWARSTEPFLEQGPETDRHCLSQSREPLKSASTKWKKARLDTLPAGLTVR